MMRSPVKLRQWLPWMAFTALLISSASLTSCAEDGTTTTQSVCEDPERRCVNLDVEVCAGGQWTSLGACPTGTACSFGDCVAECTPECGSRACGPDGCGGDCGTCDTGSSCNGSGACVEIPDTCGNAICDDGEDCAICEQDCGACCGNGTCSAEQGENCSTCSEDCGCVEGEECNEGSRTCETICEPQCTDRECGPDGCGDFCGACTGTGEVCNTDTGQCEVSECVPECGDRECGVDPVCGESCGPGCTGADEVCNTGTGMCEVPACVPECGDRVCGVDPVCGEPCGPGCTSDQTCQDDGTCLDNTTDACSSCTSDQICVDGICREDVQVCSTENPTGLCENGFECREGQCTEVTGSECSAQNPTGVCPVGRICQNGTCETFDDTLLCDDDNACTRDFFDAARNRCVHEAQTASCSDGNACTTDACSAGVCVGTPITDCVEPPTLGDYPEITNEGTVELTGTKPAGSSIEINGSEAVAESPDTTWSVTLNLSPGENTYTVRSQDQNNPSETVEVVIVFDITPPTTTITPGGGVFLRGVTVTVATDEPATVYYTTDGGTPDMFSQSFQSVRQFRVFDTTTLRFLARDVAGNWEESIVEANFEITGEDNRWLAGPTLPEALTLASAAHADDKVFIIGGSDGVSPQAGAHMYDMTQDTWTLLPTLPEGRTQAAVATLGGRLYSIGGENDGRPLNVLLELSDPGTSTDWTARSPMPSTRFGAALVTDGSNRLFVLGGKSNGGVVLSNHEVYSVSGASWDNGVAQLPRARYGHGAVYHDGKIYIVGGEDGDGAPIAEVDIYDVGSDTWSEGAPMPTPRTMIATTLQKNIGQVAGGYHGVVTAGGRTLGGAASAIVEEYIIEDDAWRERSPLPQPRHSAAYVAVERAGAGPDTVDTEGWMLGGLANQTITDTSTRFRLEQDFARYLEELPEARYKHAAVPVDSKIYLVGGRGFQEETSVVAYDPETQTTRELAAMASSQNGPGAVAARGKVYVFGGLDNFGNPVATARAYDPASDTWEELTPMPTGRSEPAVVLVGDVIYVIGGLNTVAVQTVEIFDLDAGTWSTGPILPEGRTSAVAVAHHGDIYLAGGRDPSDAIVGTVLRLREGTWSTASSNAMPVADAPGAFIHDTRFVIFGGRNAAGVTNEIYTYDVILNQSKVVASKLLDSLDLVSAAYVNGSVYVIGGNGTEGSTSPGSTRVQKINGRCFNDIQDQRETRVDGGGGCLASVVYSETLPSGSISNSSPVCQAWKDFRSELAEGTSYSRITLSGDQNSTALAGRTCTGDKANQICQALASGTSAFSTSCDGHTWTVGSCGTNSIELDADGGDCTCNSNWNLRPCINSSSWGGVNTSGACSQSTQTITVICE